MKEQTDCVCSTVFLRTWVEVCSTGSFSLYNILTLLRNLKDSYQRGLSGSTGQYAQYSTFCTTQYHSTVLHWKVQYTTILYITVLNQSPYSALHSTSCTAQYSIYCIIHKTYVWYNTVMYSTVQYSRARQSQAPSRDSIPLDTRSPYCTDWAKSQRWSPVFGAPLHYTSVDTTTTSSPCPAC